MDLTQPFRGSAAIASGLLTPGVLGGPRFRRLFPDIYVPAGAEVGLALLSRAAYLLVEGRWAGTPPPSCSVSTAPRSGRRPSPPRDQTGPHAPATGSALLYVSTP